MSKTQAAAAASQSSDSAFFTRQPIVGVILPCCCDRVIAYLSVLKAECIYCPIELATAESVLRSFNFSLIICNKSMKTKYESVWSPMETRIIVLDDEKEAEEAGDCETALLLSSRKHVYCPVGSDDECIAQTNFAHLIFTSGTSSGSPKAFACDHWGSINSHLFRNEVIPFDEDEVTGCNIFGIWVFIKLLDLYFRFPIYKKVLLITGRRRDAVRRENLFYD